MNPTRVWGGGGRGRLKNWQPSVPERCAAPPEWQQMCGSDASTSAHVHCGESSGKHLGFLEFADTGSKRQPPGWDYDRQVGLTSRGFSISALAWSLCAMTDRGRKTSCCVIPLIYLINILWHLLSVRNLWSHCWNGRGSVMQGRTCQNSTSLGGRHTVFNLE